MTGRQLYAEDHPHLTRKASAKIQQRMAELSGQLGGGLAQDWPDYKHRAGVIAGLNEALAICDETEKQLNGDR